MGCDVLIVGGGFSGLSAATALAEQGLSVTLLEKKPHLGGRAYSFLDPETGVQVDNGQHLFLGSYLETQKFLSRIDSIDLLHFSPELRVDFIDKEKRRDRLYSPRFFPPPLNFAWGLLGLRGLSLKDKILAGNILSAIKKFKKDKTYGEQLDRITVREWLNALKQTRALQERVWGPLAIGILNESPAIASALGFVQALNKILIEGGRNSANLGFASVGLSALYTEQARLYLEKAGGKILLSSKMTSLLYERNRFVGVQCENQEIHHAQNVLLALAPWELRHLNLPDSARTGWENFKAAPIIGLSLWLDRPIMKEKILGALGTEFQWIFNKTLLLNLKGPGQYLSLVISAAHHTLLWKPKKLLELAQKELSIFIGFEKAKISHWRLIKEPYATLSATPGSENLKPAPGLIAPGIYLAGDWTKTGLPATIESAVLSGHQAAQSVLEGIKKLN